MTTIRSMTSAQLRAALDKCNLSELARLSGVNVRQLRRLRNYEIEPRQATLDAITPYLKAARA